MNTFLYLKKNSCKHYLWGSHLRTPDCNTPKHPLLDGSSLRIWRKRKHGTLNREATIFHNTLNIDNRADKAHGPTQKLQVKKK